MELLCYILRKPMLDDLKHTHQKAEHPPGAEQAKQVLQPRMLTHTQCRQCSPIVFFNFSVPTSSPCPTPHLIVFCNFSLGYGPSATPVSTLRAYPQYPQGSTLANLLPALTQALAGSCLMTMCMHKQHPCKNHPPRGHPYPSLRGTAE